MLVAACTKTGTEIVDKSSDTDEKISVTISAGALSTKASVNSNEDKTIQSLQVFVFLGDNLEVYGSETGNSLTIQCTPGERDIYVLANAPTLGNIKTKSALLATVSDLKNSSVQACNSFEMIGNVTEDLSLQNSNITVTVTHIAAKVVVSSIKKQFKSAALDDMEFKILSMYLVNVAGGCTYGGSSSPTKWYNKLVFSDEIPEITRDEINTVVTSSMKYTEAHTFYAYPNPAEEDSTSETWCPRYTRLVIEAKLGEDVFYYPVSLPGIERNKSYNISEIVITRPGSVNPDTPVSSVDCTFSISVEPWADVIWTEGTTI